jgi:alkaline phosphatase D
MKKIVVLMFFFLYAYGCMHSASEKPYVVLVSLDGFRWDYNKHFDTPNLDALASKA